VVRQAPELKEFPIRIHEREKSTGFSPVIDFEILESGEVVHAHVKRSSGFAEVDAHALNWIRGAKYNRRLGCGVVESQADVLIHWGPAE
jgi:TonB family protein